MFKFRNIFVLGIFESWAYLDITALGRQEKWEDSPKGYPQTAPYDWWIWHDQPRWTDPDRPGLVQLRAARSAAGQTWGDELLLDFAVDCLKPFCSHNREPGRLHLVSEQRANVRPGVGVVVRGLLTVDGSQSAQTICGKAACRD